MDAPDQPTHTTTTIVLGDQFKLNRQLHGNLIGLEGKAFGHRYLLGGTRFAIGRDPSCDIPLDDAGVSRRHAEIRRVGDHFVVSDLGSKNGTLVQGERIDERQLCDGDLIRIGASVFKYLRLNEVELRYHDQMARLTNTDGLTGAYNRRHAWDTLEQHLARITRRGGELSLVLFDIDHFKRLNDTHGHAAGDTTLVQIVQRVQSQNRREDVLARIGGEEFLMILPDTDILEAAEVATRVRDCIARTPFDIGDGKSIPVTVSLGVTDIEEFHQAGGEALIDENRTAAADQLVALADAKLYEAKHLGRNRVAI